MAKIKSTDFTDFADVAKQESVIFVLSVGKKIKSTDFTGFADVAKEESVIFVLSVGKKNKVNRFHRFHRCCKTRIRDIRAIRWQK